MRLPEAFTLAWKWPGSKHPVQGPQPQCWPRHCPWVRWGWSVTEGLPCHSANPCTYLEDKFKREQADILSHLGGGHFPGRGGTSGAGDGGWVTGCPCLLQGDSHLTHLIRSMTQRSSSSPQAEWELLRRNILGQNSLSGSAPQASN